MLFPTFHNNKKCCLCSGQKNNKFERLVFVVKCVIERNRDGIGRCVRMKNKNCKNRNQHSNTVVQLNPFIMNTLVRPKAFVKSEFSL